MHHKTILISPAKMFISGTLFACLNKQKRINMSLFKLFVTGAAVAAGLHYMKKKRPDGSSISEYMKRKFSRWMTKAQPYIERMKGQFSKVPHIKGNAAGSSSYPRKFEDFSPDPDPAYSS